MLSMYPSLDRSYKGIFPFNLGTTSFIYPDDYVPNVKMHGIPNQEKIVFTAKNCFGILKHFGIPKSGQSDFTKENMFGTLKHFGISKYPTVVIFGRPIKFGIPNQ